MDATNECHDRARYVRSGCRCALCREANRQYEAGRMRQIVYGQWEPFVDATPVAAHVRALVAAGVGTRTIAAQSAVSRSAVTALLSGKPDRDGGRRPVRQVTVATAQRLLAVQVGPATLARSSVVSAVGTQRRCQALVANGWSMSALSHMLGKPSGAVSAMMNADQVLVGTADAVSRLYARLWNTFPPVSSPVQRAADARARSYARARGWVRPMAWDDDTIDDPGAVPQGPRSAQTRRRADFEDVSFLLASGTSVERVADRFGVSVEAVTRRVSRARQRR